MVSDVLRLNGAHGHRGAVAGALVVPDVLYGHPAHRVQAGDRCREETARWKVRKALDDCPLRAGLLSGLLHSPSAGANRPESEGSAVASLDVSIRHVSGIYRVRPNEKGG